MCQDMNSLITDQSLTAVILLWRQKSSVMEPFAVGRFYLYSNASITSICVNNINCRLKQKLVPRMESLNYYLLMKI